MPSGPPQSWNVRGKATRGGGGGQGVGAGGPASRRSPNLEIVSDCADSDSDNPDRADQRRRVVMKLQGLEVAQGGGFYTSGAVVGVVMLQLGTGR